MFLDAIGKTCPIPVVMAKKELTAGCKDLTIAVDNETAVENLKRLANSEGMEVAVEKKDGAFHIHMHGDGAAAAPQETSCGCAGSSYAVFIGKDHLGEGAQELGYNLMKMAIYTLSQSEKRPASVLFMNSGVKLVTGDEAQIIDSLKELQEQGTEVLVCGTCLNYYGIAEQLKVGTVSNMYDILERMQNASGVITL